MISIFTDTFTDKLILISNILISISTSLFNRIILYR
nr:MAG TPA: hypothetical protein [Caudoviricetes sp.]